MYSLAGKNTWPSNSEAAAFKTIYALPHAERSFSHDAGILMIIGVIGTEAQVDIWRGAPPGQAG